ncbi:MAG: twin-arginine translocation signal domain-containing protein [Bacteroidota bacterium]
MKRRNFLKTAGAGSAALTGLAAIPACTNGAGAAQKTIDPEGLKLLNETPLRAEMDIEPTLAEAVNYWQDMDGTYTSLGWPDNMMAVSLLWNGGIVAKPDLNRRTTQYKDQGAFFRFIPTTLEKLNKEGSAVNDMLTLSDYKYGPGNWQDINYTDQYWKDSPAPVLVTRWYHEGVVLESSVFVHTPSGAPVKRGDEPLYAWVRIAVVELIDGLPLEERYGFNVVVENARVFVRNVRRHNIRYEEDRSYDRKLKPLTEAYNKQKGYLLLEDGNRVRVGVAPGADCQVWFNRFTGQMPDNSFKMELDSISVLLKPEVGEQADLLIPILPASREAYEGRLAQGYEGALKEAEQFWTNQAKGTQTSISIPEGYISEALGAITQMSLGNTELNPATGKYCKVQGGWVYNDVWATPVSMEFTMMLDTLGYHDVVKKYLHIFKDEQGTVTPPGAAWDWRKGRQKNTMQSGAYTRHQGFLCTPELYKAVDWLADNGALLYAFAMHGLLSGDKQYIEEYTPAIIKSCEWIRDVCAQTNHDGYKGILPPGVSNDDGGAVQIAGPNAFNYVGLAKAVTLLKRIGHPRAEEFDKVRADFHSAFLKAYYDRYERMPEWTDAQGVRRKFAPRTLYGADSPAELRHRWYVTGGALFMVFAGILPSDDPSVLDSLVWFREGPLVKHYRRESDTRRQPSILEREITENQPVYSWNLYSELRNGNRDRFLTGLYSLWAGAISRKTFSPCENRGNGIGMVCGAATNFYLTRQALVDDFSWPGEVHLLHMAPREWLKGEGFGLKKIPTEYGPVTLSGKLDDRGTLEVSYSAEYHWEPEKVILHVPPLEEIRSVRVNGKRVSGEEITLKA